MKKNLLSRNDRSKLLVMKEKYIVIDTHGSKLLGDAVLNVVMAVRGDSFGNFPGGRRAEDTCRKYPYLCVESAGLFHRIGGDDVKELVPQIQIDAATEMGKLIELLEAPKEIVVKDVAKQEHNSTMYFATISPGGKTVKVGCSTSSFAKVEEVYLAMKSLQS